MAKKKLNRNRVIQMALFIFFLCTFFLGTYLTVSTLIEDGKAKDLYSNIRDKVTPVSTQDPTEEKSNKIDFVALKEIDSNVVAWLRLDGTIVDYPVVKGKNNEYYLRHLITGEWNKAGTLFIDYRCKNPFLDKNTIVYGHHNKQGLMFAEFKNYRKQAYYDQHKVIKIFTPEGNYEVELIAMTLEDGAHEFVRFDLQDNQAFLDYIAKLKQRSTFKSTVEISAGDKIVSFVTCSYDITNGRYLLVGKLVPVEPEN